MKILLVCLIFFIFNVINIQAQSIKLLNTDVDTIGGKEIINISVELIEPIINSGQLTYILYEENPTGDVISKQVSSENVVIFNNLDPELKYYILVHNQDWSNVKGNKLDISF